MSTPIVLPKQGQSVESCVISEWIKKKGDRVNKGDVLFSYETDKASFEFESPVSGVLLEIFFAGQEDVPVLTNVAVVGEPGESVDQFRPATVAGAGVSSEKATGGSHSSSKDMPAESASENVGLAAVEGQMKASPRAKRKAEDLGVDLTKIRGTGPNGRIIERDVLSQTPLTKTASAKLQAEGLAVPVSGSGVGGRVRAEDLFKTENQLAASPNDPVTEIKLSSMRKIIASRMLQSLQQSAQLTMNAFADATAMLAYRKKIKAEPKNSGLPDITVTDLIALAVVRTLPEFPEVNSHFKDDKIFQYKHVHLAIAVDTPRGLMVPVIKSADQLSLSDLSTTMKSLAQQCREGSINPDFLTGGTFTITNLGMFGIDSFTPVLNSPQVAILGVNTISPRPVSTDGGNFVMRPHISFSLTIDHRVVDGAPGARFLKALCDRVANINSILTV